MGAARMSCGSGNSKSPPKVGLVGIPGAASVIETTARSVRRHRTAIAPGPVNGAPWESVTWPRIVPPPVGGSGCWSGKPAWTMIQFGSIHVPAAPVVRVIAVVGVVPMRRTGRTLAPPMPLVPVAGLAIRTPGLIAGPAIVKVYATPGVRPSMIHRPVSGVDTVVVSAALGVGGIPGAGCGGRRPGRQFGTFAPRQANTVTPPTPRPVRF